MAELNHIMDEMDATVGIRSGGRYPVSALAAAMKRGTAVYNNIKIDNSTVGVVNTGILEKIDAVITISKDSDAELIGQHLKALTEAVAVSNEVQQAEKQEFLDLIQTLGEQVVGPRKKSVVLSLMTSIEDRAKGIAAIMTVASGLATAVRALFGG
jgi:hypothetical protein